MIYYFEILEILQKNKDKWLSGIEIQARFFKIYRVGSIIGINKTLKKLRNRPDIKSKKIPPNIYYKFVKN